MTEQIQTHKVPRGYKETKIGLIPDDWDVIRIKDCITSSRGIDPAKTPDKQFKYIDISAICNGTYRIQEHQVINSVNAPSRARKEIRTGDIIYATVRPYLKRLAVISKEYDRQICSTGFCVLRPTERINGRYLFHVLLTEQITQRISQLQVGTNYPAVSDSDILCQLIPLPSRTEQDEIAEVISTWDSAIFRTEKLISAKQKLKKALCQQLLTGKKRLRGFSSKWKRSQLSDLAEIIVSNVDKKINSHETPVLLCNYLDVYRNHYITNQLNFMEGRATKTEIEKFKLQMGDVIITKDSETPDDIANAATVIENLKNVICGYHLAILRPRQDVLSGLYLGQYLMLPSVRYQFTRVANGATRFGLAVSSIEEVVIDYPTFDEQQKIAEILTNCDNEIELLNCKVELMKHQKRGLMQKLLTGKIRVKV